MNNFTCADGPSYRPHVHPSELNLEPQHQSRFLLFLWLMIRKETIPQITLCHDVDQPRLHLHWARDTLDCAASYSNWGLAIENKGICYIGIIFLYSLLSTSKCCCACPCGTCFTFNLATTQPGIRKKRLPDSHTGVRNKLVAVGHCSQHCMPKPQLDLGSL